MVLQHNNQLTKLNSWINEYISAAISSRQMGLYNLMSYHFGWTGKPGEDFIDTTTNDLHNLRRYGLACLVAANSLDNSISENSAAVSAGSAIEMLATFAEIHDDIQAGRPIRNDRDAVWWVWGPAQAINAGDGLHALARLVILNLTDKDIDKLSDRLRNETGGWVFHSPIDFSKTVPHVTLDTDHPKFVWSWLGRESEVEKK